MLYFSQCLMLVVGAMTPGFFSRFFCKMTAVVAVGVECVCFTIY